MRMLCFEDCYDDGRDRVDSQSSGGNHSDDGLTHLDLSDLERGAAEANLQARPRPRRRRDTPSARPRPAAEGTLQARPRPRHERLDLLLRADQAGPALLELPTPPRISVGKLADDEIESPISVPRRGASRKGNGMNPTDKSDEKKERGRENLLPTFCPFLPFLLCRKIRIRRPTRGSTLEDNTVPRQEIDYTYIYIWKIPR
jgi:hypothetical protein